MHLFKFSITYYYRSQDYRTGAARGRGFSRYNIEPKKWRPGAPRSQYDSGVPQFEQSHQENALNNYQKLLRTRAAVQKRLSKSLQRSAQDLAMNSGDPYRFIEETRELLERCIPLVEGGKGDRVGSEFWEFPQTVGRRPLLVPAREASPSEPSDSDASAELLTAILTEEGRGFGVQRTLTMTEKGYPPPIERIVHPRFLLNYTILILVHVLIV